MSLKVLMIVSILRVDDVIRQVVVDLGVGEETSLLAQLDEVLQARLARFGVEGAGLWSARLAAPFGGLLFGFAGTRPSRLPF